MAVDSILMRFGFADPPFPGMAAMYKNHPDYGGEVDHVALVARLVDEFPDGWQLCTSASTLQYVLSICPPKVRILAWVKPYTPFKMGMKLTYAWDPIIQYGGRRIAGRTHIFDWFAYSINRFGDNSPTLPGQKPEPLCDWLFRCLGAQRDDELVDLFPGSGAVSRAWENFQKQGTLPDVEMEGKQTKIEGIPS